MSTAKLATKPTTVKARLRNSGNGILEVSDDTVKFYVETRRFRKRRETVRNIPIPEIESLELKENDLGVTWKGNTDFFAAEDTSKVVAIHERILAAMKERQKAAEAKAAEEQKQVEQKQPEQKTQLVEITGSAVEVVNSLFEVLRHLHGRIDWKLVEFSFQQVEESFGKLAGQSADFAFFDLKSISAAVQQRYPKEIAERIFEALKKLHERFNREETAPPEGSEEQLRPSQHDARQMLRAFYVWNDMTLGAVVGDKDRAEENAELLRLLEELAKQPSSKIDISTVKSSFEKLSEGREKQQEGFEELKVVLDLQLKDLMVLAPPAQEAGSESSQSVASP
jgi:hypothetical protein